LQNTTNSIGVLCNHPRLNPKFVYKPIHLSSYLLKKASILTKFLTMSELFLAICVKLHSIALENSSLSTLVSRVGSVTFEFDPSQSIVVLSSIQTKS